MFLNKNTFRVTTSVSILLVLAFLVTGFINAAYRKEKVALGESHYSKGLRLEKTSDATGAVEEFRKALIYSPDKTEYRLSFAQALINEGRVDEAESHIDQLLQEDPTNGVLNLMRGRIAAKRGQTAQAVEFYERAVYEYWPPARAYERRQARWELIQLLEQTNRREELIAELMTMYANAPNDANLRMRIGFELLKRSATAEGAQVFRDITRVTPRNSEAHRGLGEALMTGGDFVPARHELERALRLNPKDRSSAEGLALDNSIIDLDPELPGLTSADRYRRSLNLLRRVLNDLAPCEGAAKDTRVVNAKAILDAKSGHDPDIALQIERTAQQLWTASASLCGNGKPLVDEAVTKVLERIPNE